MSNKAAIICLLAFAQATAVCSGRQVWTDRGTLSGAVETQTTLSSGRTPLWLNANRYGLGSLSSAYGYVRGTVEYDHDTDPGTVCGVRAGVDVVVPAGFKSVGYQDTYTTHLIVQQLYGSIRYHNLTLTLGARQQPMLTKSATLSSGGQTLGINARPVPQVRVETERWWAVPGTRGCLSLAGHMAFGVMTDGEWQESFARGSNNKYNKYTRYHEKAGYIRFGNAGCRPLTCIFGLEMAAQFGGYVYDWHGTDQNGYNGSHRIRLRSNLHSYWNAFWPGGEDVGETQFKNAEGNQVGSWILRFDWTTPEWTAGLYADHYFEDHSSMFLLDYDGYGSGEQWDDKERWRYLVYGLKDMMLGADIKLRSCRYLKGAVVEMITTKYQSGPIYHDHNSGNSDHVGGIDDYYNHSSLSGWQHWGQVMGNPLYRSPLYNKNGYVGTSCNRFTAWHFGIEGEALSHLDYRVLYTWQEALGTYRKPFAHSYESTSLLVELTYTVSDRGPLSAFHGMSARLGYGADFGHVLGTGSGLQLTLRYDL